MVFHQFLRFSLAILIGLSLAAPTPAAAPLGEKEIAAGWLQLFDGESTFGWTADGPVKVENGQLILGGEKPASLRLHTQLGNYKLQMHSEGRGTLVFTQGEAGRQTVGIGPGASELEANISRGVGNRTSTSVSQQNNAPAQVSAIIQSMESSTLTLQTEAGETWTISRLVAQPTGQKSIFNDKDLTGWNVFKGEPKRERTTFAVTPAGELSAKDGPGDLQTEASYRDFLLQVDFKTNGKFLNSGIFFRCLPGQYQQGYEAQIQNAYLGSDRTQPVDYGTGAIYRRVKARKVVADDNAWTTMTVYARGPHVATWVNGYQVVDWTDDRPAAENARQGLYTKPGPISLQGHDPTTDLLFKNFRIAELR